MEWQGFGERLAQANDNIDLREELGIPIAHLPDDLMWVWRCFERLSADRPWYSGGMGPMRPGAIPWLLLMEWASYHDYDEEQTDFLDGCIRAMDQVYMEHCLMQAQSGMKAK